MALWGALGSGKDLLKPNFEQMFGFRTELRAQETPPARASGAPSSASRAAGLRAGKRLGARNARAPRKQLDFVTLIPPRAEELTSVRHRTLAEFDLFMAAGTAPQLGRLKVIYGHSERNDSTTNECGGCYGRWVQSNVSESRGWIFAGRRISTYLARTDVMTEAATERVSELQQAIINEVRNRPMRARGWAVAAGVFLGFWAAR